MKTLESTIDHLDRVLRISDAWIFLPGQMSDEERNSLHDACAVVHDFRCEDMPVKECYCRACERARG